MFPANRTCTRRPAIAGAQIAALSAFCSEHSLFRNAETGQSAACQRLAAYRIMDDRGNRLSLDGGAGREIDEFRTGNEKAGV